VILQAGGTGRTLSVAERMAAVNRGFQSDFTAEELGRFVLWLAAAAAAIAATAWIVARVRRLRCLLRHERTLAATGLQDDELALFRDVARGAASARMPMLVRQVAAFDRAAAVLLRRTPAAGRRQRLAALLALRRRIPFERRGVPAASFPRGLELEIVVAVVGGEPLRLPAHVVSALPGSLRVGLDESDESRAVARMLRPGQELGIAVRRDGAVDEARVRLRGAAEGEPLQWLLDRPIAFAPSRTRVEWSEAGERVQVELVERFSRRFTVDDAPVAEARVVATSTEGVILDFTAMKPRVGESLRVEEGPSEGSYRTWAWLDAKGTGGEVFAIRRSDGRSEPGAARAATPWKRRERNDFAARS
jgi:hypothetical protein